MTRTNKRLVAYLLLFLAGVVALTATYWLSFAVLIESGCHLRKDDACPELSMLLYQVATLLAVATCAGAIAVWIIIKTRKPIRTSLVEGPLEQGARVDAGAGGGEGTAG